MSHAAFHGVLCVTSRLIRISILTYSSLESQSRVLRDGTVKTLLDSKTAAEPNGLNASGFLGNPEVGSHAGAFRIFSGILPAKMAEKLHTCRSSGPRSVCKLLQA